MTRLHVPISLRWSDFDPYSHVNNAEMVRLIEEARIRLFWRDEEDPAVGATSALGEGIMGVIARQEIEYLAPIPYMRAPIDVEMWIGRIGGASLDICYELYSPAGVTPRVLYTVAATTLVMVSAETGRPQRIADSLREEWEPYVDDPIVFARRPTS
jgi:acyl-CoA thioester hydrolase